MEVPAWPCLKTTSPRTKKEKKLGLLVEMKSRVMEALGGAADALARPTLRAGGSTRR